MAAQTTKAATNIWCLPNPDAVAQVHREFLAAGADVIETDTFGAMSIVLAEYDLAEQAYALNKAAAELAKAVAAEFSTPEKTALCGRLDRTNDEATHLWDISTTTR